MPCIIKRTPNNLGTDIPLWTLEARSLPASNKTYLKHYFTIAFKSTPHITATAKGGQGLADISIINVTKAYVEIAISGPSLGMNVEMHAMALDPSFNCPCPQWITGLPGPCEGEDIDNCCEVGDPLGGPNLPWGEEPAGVPCV